MSRPSRRIAGTFGCGCSSGPAPAYLFVGGPTRGSASFSLNAPISSSAFASWSVGSSHSFV